MAGCWCGSAFKIPEKHFEVLTVDGQLTYLHGFNPKPSFHLKISLRLEVWQGPREQHLQQLPAYARQAGCQTVGTHVCTMMTPKCLSGFGIQPSCTPILHWLLCRATRGEVPWQAEASYIVPAAEKDNLPNAHEGARLEPCPSHLLLAWFFWSQLNSMFLNQI